MKTHDEIKLLASECWKKYESGPEYAGLTTSQLVRIAFIDGLEEGAKMIMEEARKP